MKPESKCPSMPSGDIVSFIHANINEGEWAWPSHFCEMLPHEDIVRIK